MQATSRRMTLAVSGSVVGHLLAGLAFAWFLSVNVQPSAVERLLVLTLRNAPSGDLAQSRATQQADTLPTATPQPARPVQRDVTTALQRRAVAQTPALTPPVVPDAIPDSAPPEPRRSADAGDRDMPDDDASAMPPVGQPGVASTDSHVVLTEQSDRRVATQDTADTATPLVRVAMARSQQVMLEARMRKMAENMAAEGDAPHEQQWKTGGQDYHARFYSVPARDDTALDQVIVEVSTVRDGTQWTTALTMKKLAFSNYAQFVHRWNPDVHLHDDALDGRFHSNSRINIAYDRDVTPAFLGKVTTASGQVAFTDTRGHRHRDEIFRGGLETGVRRIRLPPRYVPFPAGLAPGDADVHRFDAATRIAFHADGSYDWRQIDTDVVGRGKLARTASTYLLAAKDSALYLKGTVNGRVLVYSPADIVIEGDLRYAVDPTFAADSDDFLGLVSDSSVEIAGPAVTGPGDLTVQAAIYARQGFNVRNYRARPGASLCIHGSLTARSLSATEPRYATRITFDRRLEKLRPPGFPVTDHYEVETTPTTWRMATPTR